MYFNKSVKFLVGFFKQICPETASYFELMYGQVLQQDSTGGVSIVVSPKSMLQSKRNSIKSTTATANLIKGAPDG
jgi:hypothetical protein